MFGRYFFYPNEGTGIKKLHQLMLDEYFTKPFIYFNRNKFGTEHIYKKQGWKNVGFHGEEIKFEMSFKDWKNKALKISVLQLIFIFGKKTQQAYILRYRHRLFLWFLD